jgi:hypothetical protein
MRIFEINKKIRITRVESPILEWTEPGNFAGIEVIIFLQRYLF